MTSNNYEASLTDLLAAEEKANKIIRDAEAKKERILDEAQKETKKNIDQLRESLLIPCNQIVNKKL